ncbi:GNAT family N-acetyltransferase [Sorangium sp. So ce1153]|uniref:GNAT family N-acetyltransferase n=1 Tax=Sorangium sp. So ce1153 TaxID=3133333 RepID=UPI003F63C289
MTVSERFSPIVDARPEDTAWPVMPWPPAPGTRLTGHVVELSPCDPDRDAEPLFRALDHDAVWRHLAGRPGDPGAAAAGLRARQAQGFFVWIVRLLRPYAGLPEGAVVGTTSYLEVSARDARLEIGGTAYAPAVWSTQVNPEAKLQLLAYAFDVLRAGRVQLKTDVRNVRSQQAIARLGARYEGTLRRYQRRDDGTVRDTVLFSILAEEWPAVREGLRERAKGVNADR